MAIEWTGDIGAIRYGYMVAAIVRDWRVARDGDERVLTGMADEVNDLMVSQQPLRFVAQRDGAVPWPIVTLEITGASVRATLGPRESQ